MSAQTPGGDPRFGGPAAVGGAGESRFGSLPSAGSAPMAGPAPMASPGVGGFAVATRAARPGAQRRTGTPRWLGITVVVVVVAVGVSMFGIYHAQAQRTKAARSVFVHTTLTIPDTAAGLTHGTGPGVSSAEQRAVLALAQSQALQTVSSGWLDADGNSYAFIAAGRHVTSAHDFSSTVGATAKHFGSGIAAGGDAAAVALTDQPAGALGGIMRCGAVKVSGVPATLCVAVDAGSISEMLVATTDQKAAAATARVLREAVVKRTA